MHRLALVPGLAMLPATVAVTKTCRDVSCNDDVFCERIGTMKDRINGLDDHDVIDANRDVLRGSPRGDKPLTNGTDGRDVCYVSPDDATRSCERVIENVRAGTSAVPQDAPVKAFSS